MASDPSTEPARKPSVAPLSDLAKIRAEIEAQIFEPARLVHPLMSNYTLIFRSDLTREELQAIRKRCRDGKEFDLPKFDAMVLNATNIGIEKDGELIVDSAGDDVTFASPEFQEAFQVGNGADCAKFFLRSDSALSVVSSAVIDKAGFNRDVEDAPKNPTQSL